MPPDPIQLEPTAAVAHAEALVTRSTEQLRSTTADLLATQAVVELLLEVAGPVAIVEDGTVRGWSAALEELTGTRAAEAVGRPVGAPFATATWSDAGGRSWAVARHGGGHGFEALVLVPDVEGR